ncbi:stalk domain-containing protein [Paenibacillus alkaliterrae]
MEFNPRAFLANGTTMVPFRQLFEELGATVSYDEKNAVYKCY